MTVKLEIVRYFKPKTFELYRGKTIYEWVYIQTYKKYLLTISNIIGKRKKITQTKSTKAEKLEALYKYERKTRNYEWRHLLGILLFILLTIIIDKKMTLFDWIFLPILNLYVNVYPIFLQRYNRIRVIRILQNHGQQSPYNYLTKKTTQA